MWNTRTRTHTPWHNSKPRPLRAHTHWHIPTLVCLYNPRPALFSLSICLTSVSTLPPHRLLWVTRSPTQRNIIQDIYRGADSPDNSRAAWGAACHVFPNTTSGSPARVSYAGTGKDGITIPHKIPHKTLNFVFSLYFWCLFKTEPKCHTCLAHSLWCVILDSLFQLEGILVFHSVWAVWFKWRLWGLWGQS